ncbi:hypothetical protein D9753_02310 [Streptomyces dangxiongensis]|uniref:Uncharacterized protein n=1 Tax=Streptomyces dangxiongensis TaxID=1442032 RepID=A0A3G2JQU8_9ACTN|nr:hypothetical protein D9753_02310 [Streptomyces dangxiongensis]
MATRHDTVALLAHIPLPPLDLLSDARARGAQCIWGGEPLTTATAIDLGERVTNDAHWFPRACLRCTRSAVRAARNSHPGQCEQCVDGTALCETRHALHDLLLELRR